jgi:hypothetical protein
MPPVEHCSQRRIHEKRDVLAGRASAVPLPTCAYLLDSVSILLRTPISNNEMERLSS